MCIRGFYNDNEVDFTFIYYIFTIFILITYDNAEISDDNGGNLVRE